MFGERRNRRRIDQGAVRAAARGVLARAIKALAIGSVLASICAASAFGAARARTYLTTSPTFALEAFTFEGVRHADPEELRRLSGIALGDNLFQIDLLAAQKAMSANAWVERLSLEREYPRTLVARIIEHEPAALADLGGLYYVDEAGKPFKKLGPGEGADLPVLSGVTRDEYLAHEPEIEALFCEALGALDAFRDSGLEARMPASEVKVDRVDGLTLWCGEEALAVKLGFHEYREKFQKLERLLTELKSRGERAEVIRLDNRTRPGWVAVQLAQGAKQDR